MTETEMDVILYTAQQPVVLEALERDGRSVVRREYIDKKYGDTSWVFQEAYSFSGRMPPHCCQNRRMRNLRSGFTATAAGASWGRTRC